MAKRGRHGGGGDPVADYILSLPDQIADAEARGQPIVFETDGEPPEHVQKLMATLGVRVEVSAAERIGTGELSQAEQHRRHQEFLDGQPLTVKCSVDECTWTFDGPAGEAREAARAHRAEAHVGAGSLSGRDRPWHLSPLDEYRIKGPDGKFGCRIDGCQGRARANRGVYAYLCDEHAAPRPAPATARDFASAPKPPPKAPRPPAVPTPSYTGAAAVVLDQLPALRAEADELRGRLATIDALIEALERFAA